MPSSRLPQRLLALLDHPRSATIGEGPEVAVHGVIVIAVAAEVAIRLAGGEQLGAYAAAAGIIAALSTFLMVAAALAEPARAIRLSVAVALANMTGLGVLLAGIPDLVLAPAVLLPQVYLVRLLGVRGAAYGVLGVGLFLAPSLIAGPDEHLAVAATTALLGLGISLVIAVVTRAWSIDREQLAHARAVVDTVIDTVDVGLLLMDAEGRYLVINRQHLELIALAHPEGYPGHEAADTDAPGSPVHIYEADRVTPVPPRQRPSQRAARGEHFESQLVWIGPPDAPNQRAVSASARPVWKADRLDGTLLAYDDVTAAMEALRAKDGFIAMVSHELRTPLTSIMGYLDLALDTPGLPTEAAEHLAVVERNALRLLRLVADLLDVASAADGHVQMVMGTVPLHDLVAESVAELQVFAGDQGLEIITDLEECPPIEADAHRLGQVVENLLTNAIKYAGGSSQVRVRVHPAEDGVRLVVSDDGIGMSRDELDQAFSQFFRSPTLEDQSIAGVGLGLSITRSIVERHGGRIRLESSPGRGTTAVVDLPATGPG